MNFIAAMRAQFNRSQVWVAASLALKVVLVLGTASMLCLGESSAAAMVVFVLAALAQVLMFVCRWRADVQQEIGNDLRLAALLGNGLGIQPTAIEIARLKDRTVKYEEGENTSGYYNSSRAVGPARLVEITAESAFFSESLARRSANLIWWMIAVAVTVLVFTLASVAVAGLSTNMIRVVAKIVVIGVTFWATDDLIAMALRYGAFRRACEAVLVASDAFLTTGSNDERRAQAVLAQYHGAAACSPPLPGFLYRRYNKRLTEIWASRSSQ